MGAEVHQMLTPQLLMLIGVDAAVVLALVIAINTTLRNSMPAATVKAPALEVPIHQTSLSPVHRMAVAQISAQFCDGDAPLRFDVDESGKSTPRFTAKHRQSIAQAKVMSWFLKWMMREGYSGWYLPHQVYESFRIFAWEHALEEIDYRGFLAALLEQPGVRKKRAYIHHNETFRHLRKSLPAHQERAVVYALPTEAEFAAASHRRDLKQAESLSCRPVSRRGKVRLSPGGQEQAAAVTASSKGDKKGSEYSDVLVADSGLRRAA